jgi:predicted ATP-grasp superfamily ATP-dependent carboligase
MSPHQPIGTTLGKAIYFAPKTCLFPATTPWSTITNADVWTIPEFADIPSPGTVIEQGQPVLTLFAQGIDRNEVMSKLGVKAGIVDRLLG